MAKKKYYLGSVGPFLYDDTDLADPQGLHGFTGEVRRALLTDGEIAAVGGGGFSGTYFKTEYLQLKDLNGSNILSLVWNEDDIADRILNLLVNAADRSIDLSGDVTVESDAVLPEVPHMVSNLDQVICHNDEVVTV